MRHADEMPQRFCQLVGQGRSHELRQYLIVRNLRVYHILQAVVVDELVEIIRGNHHCPRHEDTHTLPLVVQVVFLQDMVQERQSSALAA